MISSHSQLIAVVNKKNLVGFNSQEYQQVGYIKQRRKRALLNACCFFSRKLLSVVSCAHSFTEDYKGEENYPNMEGVLKSFRDFFCAPLCKHLTMLTGTAFQQ
jgi:hypothetical protein